MISGKKSAIIQIYKIFICAMRANSCGFMRAEGGEVHLARELKKPAIQYTIKICDAYMDIMDIYHSMVIADGP